jgi:hypothetical protein
MITHSRSLMMSGAGLATAAVVAAASVTSIGPGFAAAPAISVPSSVTLLSQSHSLGADANAGGPLGGIITNFLDNNQAIVLGLAGRIPTISLGPVKIGQSVLADAYYSGYGGSAPGVQGVVAYLAGQIGGSSPNDLIKNVVLGLTANIPAINLGPVPVGHSVLANAYFNGYNGSPVGVPGLISYVTSQLHLPGLAATPAAAVVSSAKPGAKSAVGAPSDLVKTLILSLTANIPTFTIGPVAVGRSVLANAYFSGYQGSPVGVQGLIAYVVSQLHLGLPAAGVVPRASAAVSVSVPRAAVTAPRVVVSAPRSAAATNKAAVKAVGGGAGASSGPRAAASAHRGE